MDTDVKGRVVLLACEGEGDASPMLLFAGVVAGDLYANTLDPATRVQGLPDDWSVFLDNNQLLLPVYLFHAFLDHGRVTTLADLGGASATDDPRLPRPLQWVAHDMASWLKTPDNVQGYLTAQGLYERLHGASLDPMTTRVVLAMEDKASEAVVIPNFRKRPATVDGVLREAAKNARILQGAAVDEDALAALT